MAHAFTKPHLVYPIIWTDAHITYNHYFQCPFKVVLFHPSHVQRANLHFRFFLAKSIYVKELDLHVHITYCMEANESDLKAKVRFVSSVCGAHTQLIANTICSIHNSATCTGLRTIFRKRYCFVCLVLCWQNRKAWVIKTIVFQKKLQHNLIKPSKEVWHLSLLVFYRQNILK